MKKYIIPFLLLSFNYAYTQQIAITEKGEEVILNENGTWKYRNENAIPDEEKIPRNKTNFKKSKEASFLLKSNNMPIGFWINPKEWSFKKATANEDAEYQMQLKTGDLYAMVITEKIKIPLPTLRRIAIDNAKEVSYDLEVTKEEYRTVNDLEVLYLRMEGTIDGVEFTYNSYYYSCENGSLQFITYTAKNLFSTFEKESEQLLNGLVGL